MSKKIVDFKDYKKDNGEKVFRLARDIMPLLGYKKWERFLGVINRTIKKNKEKGINTNVIFFLKEPKSTGGRPRLDFELSKYACYLISLECDSKKEDVLFARLFFEHEFRINNKKIDKKNFINRKIKSDTYRKLIDESTKIERRRFDSNENYFGSLFYKIRIVFKVILIIIIFSFIIKLIYPFTSKIISGVEYKNSNIIDTNITNDGFNKLIDNYKNNKDTYINTNIVTSTNIDNKDTDINSHIDTSTNIDNIIGISNSSVSNLDQSNEPNVNLGVEKEVSIIKKDIIESNVNLHNDIGSNAIYHKIFNLFVGMISDNLPLVDGSIKSNGENESDLDRERFIFNLRGHDLIESYFIFGNLGLYKESCSILSSDICNPNYNLYSFKQNWLKTVEGFNVININKIDGKTDKGESIYCVVSDYKLKNDLNPNRIIEKFQFKTIINKKGEEEIVSRLCESMSKGDRNIKCPYILDKYYCK